MPTAEASVAETMAGIQRSRRPGRTAFPRSAATADLLRQILAPIPDDLRRLRDRAHLLIGSRARCAAPSLPGSGRAP